MFKYIKDNQLAKYIDIFIHMAIYNPPKKPCWDWLPQDLKP